MTSLPPTHRQTQTQTDNHTDRQDNAHAAPSVTQQPPQSHNLPSRPTPPLVHPLCTRLSPLATNMSHHTTPNPCPDSCQLKTPCPKHTQRKQPGQEAHSLTHVMTEIGHSMPCQLSTFSRQNTQACVLAQQAREGLMGDTLQLHLPERPALQTDPPFSTACVDPHQPPSSDFPAFSTPCYSVGVLGCGLAGRHVQHAAHGFLCAGGHATCCCCDHKVDQVPSTVRYLVGSLSNLKLDQGA